MESATQSSEPESTQPKKLRWRIIPGIFLGVFTFFGSLGMAGQLFTIAYFNIKYGWVQVDPEYPSMSRLAVTPLNVMTWQCGFWGILAGGIATYAWLYARWRLAWVCTILWFVLMQAANWLNSLPRLN